LNLRDKKSYDDPEEYDDITLRELASIYRSDLSLIISEEEMKLLTQTYQVPAHILHYLPFLISKDDLQEYPSCPSFSERIDFMTIGNWKHGPNKDSVHYLKKEIWPEVRKQLPKSQIHVYGAYGPGAKSDLHDPETGFLIEGWKESKIEAFTSHRICLAPLRYGAGLKGKLFDALRFGTPSVTTSVGSEGISDAKLWNGDVCDLPEKFVEAAVNLYSVETLWNEAQAKGKHILLTRFSEEVFLPEFAKRIQTLHANLRFHRRKNVTGALLWHHSAQSTKYLSKWIEAKNKNAQ
jgi:glycosyltransferase involved in cell wall biosynthesis